MGADTHGSGEPVIRNMEQIHELLPSSCQLTAIGHPGHPPLLIRVKVYRGKELTDELRVIVKVKRDHMFNTKLLHQVQSFSKVRTMLVLPQVMHFYPFDIHIGILLVLDDIQISESLLLVPKQLTTFDRRTRVHIWVELPETDVLRLWYLVHALSGFLVLAS